MNRQPRMRPDRLDTLRARRRASQMPEIESVRAGADEQLSAGTVGLGLMMSPDTLDATACLARLVIDDLGDIPVFGLPLDSIGTVISVTPNGLELQAVVRRTPQR